MFHRDEIVNDAIVRLSDALCEYERATFIDSVLIIRERKGFVYRAISGKSNVPNNLSDDKLLEMFI